MPERAIDNDRVEPLVAEPLERTRNHTLVDGHRIQGLLGVSPVQILQDVAGIDDDEPAVLETRNLETRIERPQLLTSIRGQGVDQLIGEPLQLQADRNLARERADRASVQDNGHACAPWWRTVGLQEPLLQIILDKLDYTEKRNS